MIYRSITDYFNNQNDNVNIPYPWKDLFSGLENFYLFGYGSLINEYSSQKDLKKSKMLFPANAYGVKRILNYSPDENVRKRSGYNDPDRGEQYSAAFNIELTKKPEDRANGVLRLIRKSDFEAFVAREVGYSLIKIPCLPFDGDNQTIIEAYTLCAPHFYNDRQLVDNTLMPNVPYYNVCKKGALDISQDFLDEWLATSFIGDGRNVSDWEADEKKLSLAKN